MSGKEPATAAGRPPDPARRTWLKLAWSALTASASLVIASSVRFLYPNALLARSERFAIGTQEDYDHGVDGRWKDERQIWIVKEPDRIYALFAECTHLGCSTNWSHGERRFKCPCHGSDFRIDGANVCGPAPRPLDRTRIVRAEDGQIVIDKTRKFTWEQRQQPEAYLAV
jgi:cytochrome b6-f complex iron-sulfur subunit